MKPKGEMKKKNNKVKCHYCGSRDTHRRYIPCSTSSECPYKFCDNCLRSFFGTDPNALKRKWECMACQNKCNCKKCDKKRSYIIQLNEDPRIMSKSYLEKQRKKTKMAKKKNEGIINLDGKDEKDSVKNKRKKKVKRKHTMRKPPNPISKEEAELGKGNEEEKSNKRVKEHAHEISHASSRLYTNFPVNEFYYLNRFGQVQHPIQRSYLQPAYLTNQYNRESDIIPRYYLFPTPNIKEGRSPGKGI